MKRDTQQQHCPGVCSGQKKKGWKVSKRKRAAEIAGVGREERELHYVFPKERKRGEERENRGGGNRYTNMGQCMWNLLNRL